MKQIKNIQEIILNKTYWVDASCWEYIGPAKAVRNQISTTGERIKWWFKLATNSTVTAILVPSDLRSDIIIKIYET